MSKTISATLTSAVVLTSTANNPVTLTSTAKLTPTSVSNGALYGQGGLGTGWTITNAGLVSGGSIGNGIQLGASGTYVGASVITNQTGGTISGKYGIRVYNSAASSSITNQTGASITAIQSDLGSEAAVYMYGSGTVTNFGAITAPTANSNARGVFLVNGGVVINNSTGTIAGGVGVLLNAIGTVTNAGTIKAGSTTGFAVEFTENGGNELVVDPQAVFYGGVAGNGGTLALASVSNAGTVVAGNLTATNFTGFNAIDFNAGAKWTLAGSSAALTGIISGFTTSDTIDLIGFFATAASYAGGNLTLTNSSNAHATLHFSGGPFNASTPHVTTNAGGTALVSCYAEGTGIATERGDVPVEQLREGDRVHSHLSGQFVPVKWIGRQRINCAWHPDPCKVWPVRVRAEAFGPNMPRRDLFLSPDHAVYVDKVLVPVRLLINGSSITQVPADEIAYYHVELAQHDVLLAEGMPAESYLDIGDRANFDNHDASTRLVPDFAAHPADIAQRWEAFGCAPLVVTGPQLEAVRRRVNEWANGMAHAMAA